MSRAMRLDGLECDRCRGPSVKTPASLGEEVTQGWSRFRLTGTWVGGDAWGERDREGEAGGRVVTEGVASTRGGHVY